MTITYPLDIPTTFGASSFTIDLVKAVAVSESPFNFSQQVQEHPGEAWEISFVLNLLNRDQSEDYNAFILKLGGRLGSFTTTIAGSETPRGVATGTPVVNGADQTGRTLITDGWTVSTTNILKAGDFIQIGTGSSTRLHKVLDNVDSDAGGNATFDIAPKIVTAPSDDQAIIVTNAKGLFRLNSNVNPVSITPPNLHSISFSAREVR
jgi:hypothetical protein